MGDRYILTVVCPKCGYEDDDVYYAPTCGFNDWACKCGHVVDLATYTGITEADASNRDVLQGIVDKYSKKNQHDKS